MLIVPEQDSINAVVRAILEKSDRDIRVVNDAEFTEIPLSGDYILELFAAGIAADAPVKNLVEGDPALNPYIHWLMACSLPTSMPLSAISTNRLSGSAARYFPRSWGAICLMQGRGQGWAK